MDLSLLPHPVIPSNSYWNNCALFLLLSSKAGSWSSLAHSYKHPSPMPKHSAHSRQTEVSSLKSGHATPLLNPFLCFSCYLDKIQIPFPGTQCPPAYANFTFSYHSQFCAHQMPSSRTPGFVFSLPRLLLPQALCTHFSIGLEVLFQTFV